MSRLDGLRHRLYVLRRGNRYGSEVERELRFHVELEMLAQSHRTLADAETSARRRLGNATYYREEVRRMTSLQWMDRIRQDSTYAWRGLRRSPVFTLTVVATLGLGLGVNVAMYSFLDRLFARNPGGVVAPDGVKRLYIDRGRALIGRGNRVYGSFNYPLFKAVRERVDSATPLAAFTPSDSVALTSGTITASTRASYVSGEYFQLLHLRPLLGRFFVAEEGTIDVRSPVAVIGEALWRRAFASDPGILGRVVSIKGESFTVVGVAPVDFAGVDANLAEIWMPLNCFPVETYDKRPWYAGNGNYLRAIARVDHPPELSRLRTAGTTAIRTMQRARPDTLSALIPGPLIEARGPVEEQREVSISKRLAGVAFIVLIIACANVANLLLLRAASRQRELAIRRALGVSRGRLYGQLLTESLMLALLAGGAALLFALWGGGALSRILLPRVHWAAAPIDGRVVVMTAMATVVVGLLAGLLPAIGATKAELTGALKAGARNEHQRTSRAQTALLIAQTALSVVLLVGAGLLVRSLMNVKSIDLGYDADGIVITNTYIRDTDRSRSVGAGLVEAAERLRATPGVRSLALASVAPMNGYAVTEVYLPGRDSVVKIAGEYPTYNAVSSDFVQVLGIPLLAGRALGRDDRAGAMPVAVVGQELARGLWPGEDPLGKCIIIAKPTNGCTSVVGVVGDTHRMQIIEKSAPQFYLPLAQQPTAAPQSLVLRVDQAQAAAVVAAVRAELARLMPDADDYAVRSMEQILEPQLRPWRMGAVLFSALGLLALIVASVGIYGVMAYAMTQRTHEMGVRLALGARAADILNLVLGNGLRVVLIGVAIGVGVALALGRLVSSLLFGVVANDVSVLILAVVTLCSLAAVACLIPGWRAARVDPMIALRSE
jgi:predicted permease